MPDLVIITYLPAFKPLMRSEQMLGAYDFVQLNDTVFDDDDHGTNVLSCMAAYKPGKIVGTAPLASYLLLRSEDAPTEYLVEEYNWLAAAEYADSAGVDIITSSLGYTTFDDKRTSHTKNDLNGKTAVISRAAGMAAAKGIMVVNSAGNEGDGLWKYIGVPADADNIFTIGAVDAKGEYAGVQFYWFSQG
jgi:serine protease AprX